MECIVGKIAKRYTFSLHNHLTHEYTYLVSFIDVLLPDMEDYCSDLEAKQPILYRVDSVNSKKYDKVYLSIDYFQITEVFLNKPEENFSVNKTQFVFEHKINKKNVYPIIIDLKERNVGLGEILPKHDCLTYLDFWQDDENWFEQKYGNVEKTCEQLSSLSLRYLNFDIMTCSNILGNLYILRYNPFIKKLDVSCNKDLKSIHLRIHNRPGVSSGLNYFLSNKHSNQVYHGLCQGTISKDQKNVSISLAGNVDAISLFVWDENGDLVHVSENSHFIMQTELNLNLKSFEIVLDGNKQYDKFETIQMQIPGKDGKEELFSIENEKLLYKKMEENLDFAFFDGIAKDENIQRAKKFIESILNCSKDKLYICDPYFDKEVLESFVLGVKKVNVNVKILMAKTWEKQSDALQMKNMIDEYNQDTRLEPISCKVMKGNSDLHDRYIVADDVVWLIGTSLNNIGKKISTIVKIPSRARLPVIEKIEKLWFSDKADLLADSISEIHECEKQE